MQQLTQGTNYVPSFRTGTDVNTLQERYFRELKKRLRYQLRIRRLLRLCYRLFLFDLHLSPSSDRCCPLCLSSKEVSERR